VVVVGEEEDLQSFDKRDGSHLELFDCPSPQKTTLRHKRSARFA
jgi:hypothetical protein